MRATYGLRPKRVAIRLAITGAALVGLAGAARASIEFVIARPTWRLSAPVFDDVARPALAPGNDTRINLIWLMRSLRPVSDAGAGYAKPADENEALGHSFLTWTSLRESFWPYPGHDDAITSDSTNCAPPVDAVVAFSTAVAADKSVPANERTALAALRGKVGCGEVDWSVPIASSQGREYLAYLQATAAFYDEDWQVARERFAALT